ncbi:hypothetical protein [Mycobacterium xenopi]|uniref:hypothetical protein n=1 Tax=Mycobacterium xenopi TaxID=1789 RepID=UPI0004535010|nr:hypothetical protein [Mycobacterium xenopi]EUA43508.1 hypothetical protein I552_8249 [Mycobacterium xenopi 3993]MDA3641036.1 hypothetical protein [Mycobacterium xenopi]MDA3656491.1 hypothetical protein [Mycobacterium xenopi]MDA3662882.1 hypothetical protein [Mycobacterium xenopi]
MVQYVVAPAVNGAAYARAANNERIEATGDEANNASRASSDDASAARLTKHFPEVEPLSVSEPGLDLGGCPQFIGVDPKNVGHW